MTKKHGKKHDTEYKSHSDAACAVDVESNKKHEEKGKVAITVEQADACQEHTETGACNHPAAEQPQLDAAAENAEKLAACEAKCKELQDQYLRKAADFDNYRKRMIREKQEAIEYANTQLISDLLQILDDFDRAIDAGKKTESGNTSAFMQGMLMIQSGLLTLLESKYALHYYEAAGTVFDPELHEAVATNPSTEVTEPTVGAELQKGYKLKDRIIRPSKVMVLMPQQNEKA